MPATGCCVPESTPMATNSERGDFPSVKKSCQNDNWSDTLTKTLTSTQNERRLSEHKRFSFWPSYVQIFQFSVDL